MKNPINGLNKVFDNRIRLGVMSILMVNEEINFNDLKQMLEVTDGNLATHVMNLEAPALVPLRPSMNKRPSLINRSSTPQVKAPWEPPPCKATLTRLRPL